MKFETKTIHAGMHADPTTGAIMTPIYQTSTYAQSAPGVHKGYEYSRTHNPTRTALQENLAALESAQWGLVFASGMAATDTVTKLLKPNDEVIASNDLYGGTYRIFTKVFQDYGIKFHFVDMSDIANIQAKINPNTKLIWAETPTNPLLKIVDLKAVAEIAKSNKVLLAVDNTFASPYLQTPLNLSADLVVHSATKYIGGHSDVVMGAICGNSPELFEKLSFIQNACGAVPGPMDCFLAIRGIKTLHVRMDRHCQNAAVVTEFLLHHPKIAKVYYPGLNSHAGHEIAKKQMRGFGGMLSFELKDDSIPAAHKFLSSLKIFALAESLGGVESLAGHPATMTHASIPKEEREKAGLRDSLIRLSIGIENVDDLIADLQQALR
ncbi:MAG: cystathionine gamma-synthase [Bacteroidia bacterium]|nr:cystathionine gamma-synthase [Bacteroidia bacterium]MCO5253104.1 cystathionine gamma-synthase [Bacteroidota bacterium]